MINLIVAYNKKRVIGDRGKIPWILPEDLKRFKRITSGNPVIMGRKTHESIGKVLPKRYNIIVTRNKDYIPVALPAFTAHSISGAIEFAKSFGDNIFIIGGEEIYKQSLPLCDRMYITYYHEDESDGDSRFPSVKKENWMEKKREEKKGYTYFIFERNNNEGP